MSYDIIIFLVLITVGYIAGHTIEKRHYRSIISREKELNHLPVVTKRFPPKEIAYEQQLVTGSVVISSDYFKTFVAGLRNLFGGNVSVFESLLDRARRESLLRLKAEAQKLNAEMVFCLRYETSQISGKRNPSIEVLVYGTALIRPIDSSS